MIGKGHLTHLSFLEKLSLFKRLASRFWRGRSQMGRSSAFGAAGWRSGVGLGGCQGKASARKLFARSLFCLLGSRILKGF